MLRFWDSPKDLAKYAEIHLRFFFAQKQAFFVFFTKQLKHFPHWH